MVILSYGPPETGNKAPATNMKDNNPTTTKRRFILTIYPELHDLSQPIPEDGRFACDRFREYAQTLPEKLPTIRYFAASLETGEAENHEHIHVYLELKTPSRFSAIKRVLGDDVHIDACMGTQADNLDYVFATGAHSDKLPYLIDSCEFGQKAKDTGESGVYDAAIKMMLGGESIKLIVEELGGGILSQIGNLQRLQAIIHQEKTSNKDTAELKKRLSATEEENRRLKLENETYSVIFSQYPKQIYTTTYHVTNDTQNTEEIFQ